MEVVVAILQSVSAMSPLAVIALLGIIIFMLVRNRQQVGLLGSNHLHSLPDIELEIHKIANGMDKIDTTLRRIEVKLGEDMSYLRARLNNNSR